MTEAEKAAEGYIWNDHHGVDDFGKKAFLAGIEWHKKYVLEKTRGCVEEIKIHHEGFKGEWDESKDMVEFSNIEELCKANE